MLKPPLCIDGWEDCRDDMELVHYVRTELDLILEGQDGTGHFTCHDIASIRRWLAKQEPDPLDAALDATDGLIDLVEPTEA